MTIYVIANQKGGVGKTTLSTNLAVALSKKGQTILVDGDDQQSSIKWSKRRTQDPIPTIALKDNLKEKLQQLKQNNNYVVLDVAGRDSAEFRSALLIADVLIIPTQPSQTDIEVLPFVLRLVNAAKQVNKNLKTFVVLNKAPTNTKSTEIDAALELLQQVRSVKTLSTIVRDRKQFRDAMIEGKSVLEMGSSKAKDELNEFFSGDTIMAKKPLIVDFDNDFEMEQAFINAAGSGKLALESSSGNNIIDLPIELIDFSKHQPRIITDNVLQEVEILATSIAVNGQIYPIVVIKKNERYELVGGEKRFRAVRDVLKNKTIRAIIRDDKSTEKIALISLIDNLHRSNLSDFELINTIQKHCNEFGYSIQNIEFITQKYQLDQSKYFRLMSFYKLPDYIKEDLKTHPKAISGATAQQLLTELNKLVLKFNNQLVEVVTLTIWKKYLNEFTETHRPSKKFIYEIEKALTTQETTQKQTQKIINSPLVNKVILKTKSGLKFGSIKIEKNLNGKTVLNIRTSLNAELDQEKMDKLEEFLANLDNNP